MFIGSQAGLELMERLQQKQSNSDTHPSTVQIITANTPAVSRRNTVIESLVFTADTQGYPTFRKRKVKGMSSFLTYSRSTPQKIQSG